jgi:hypothetical protein
VRFVLIAHLGRAVQLAGLSSPQPGQVTSNTWLLPSVGVLPLPNTTETVPSGPAIGWEPWSWSQAFGSAEPLKSVHTAGLAPLISIPADQVAPPSVDWLK